MTSAFNFPERRSAQASGFVKFVPTPPGQTLGTATRRVRSGAARELQDSNTRAVAFRSSDRYINRIRPRQQWWHDKVYLQYTD